MLRLKTESIQRKITCKFVGPVGMCCSTFSWVVVYIWLAGGFIVYYLLWTLKLYVAVCTYLCSMGSPITWVQFLWVLLYLQTSYLTIITRTLHFTRTTNMEVFFALFKVCCFLILDKSASAVSKAKS